MKKQAALNFVMFQICCCHFIKIVAKYVEESSENEEKVNFFKYVMLKAINISNFNEIWVWFEAVCGIMLNPKISF